MDTLEVSNWIPRNIPNSTPNPLSSGFLSFSVELQISASSTNKPKNSLFISFMKQKENESKMKETEAYFSEMS